MNALGLTHLCFRVEAADDLTALAEQYGGRLPPRRRSRSSQGFGEGGGSIETVHITDPDGMRIECIVNQPDMAEGARQLFAAGLSRRSDAQSICNGRFSTATTRTSREVKRQPPSARAYSSR